MRPLLLLSSLACCCSAFNIAIFVPYMANSQVIFNKRVAETLANAGHNVTLFVLALYEYDFPPVTVASNVNYQFLNISTGLDGEQLMKLHTEMFFKTIPIWDRRMISSIKMMTDMIYSCEKLISNTTMMNYIADQHFDIAFAYMHSFCPIGVIHATRIPTWIWMNSGTLTDYVAELMGVPLPPSYVTPTMMDADDNLNFFQRVGSFVGWQIFRLLWPRLFANRETAMFRRHFGPNFPDLIDLAKKTPLVMVNSNEMYDFARPTLAKIINVGGIGIQSRHAKPLEGEYKSIANNSSGGHVVMSFGSIAPMFLMPDSWKDAFFYAFEQFPDVQFFIRYEKDDLGDALPPNVHLAKWLPQNDLLQHSKARGIITHGGYNSLQDAIHAGVPMMTIPLFFDQPRNAHLAEKLGFGVTIRKHHVTRDTVYNALKKMLTNPTMHASARRLSAMVAARPVSPEQLLLKWTELVAQFRTLENLAPVGASLPLFQYHCLDVIAFLALLALVGLYATRKMAGVALRYAFPTSGPAKLKVS